MFPTTSPSPTAHCLPLLWYAAIACIDFIISYNNNGFGLAREWQLLRITTMTRMRSRRRIPVAASVLGRLRSQCFTWRFEIYANFLHCGFSGWDLKRQSSASRWGQWEKRGSGVQSTCSINDGFYAIAMARVMMVIARVMVINIWLSLPDTVMTGGGQGSPCSDVIWWSPLNVPPCLG